MTDPTLFKPPPPTGKLTDRQRFAYEFVRDHSDGVSVDEMGAALHGRRRSHHADDRCQWCGSDGGLVLNELRSGKNGRLVKRRQFDGMWVLRDPAAESGAAAENADPFPEGY